jgi:protein O-GlcNAc transferase
MTLLDAIQVARQHHAARRFPEAEATYRQLLASDPQNPDALHGLGWLAHQVGNHQAALQLLEMALQGNETDYVLHWHIATVSERLGRIDRADAAYARACQLMPKERDLLNRWGVFLASNSKGERALKPSNAW